MQSTANNADSSAGVEPTEASMQQCNPCRRGFTIESMQVTDHSMETALVESMFLSDAFLIAFSALIPCTVPTVGPVILMLGSKVASDEMRYARRGCICFVARQ